MRLIFVIMFLIAVCMSNQAFAAATVFFKDGLKEVGTSAWIEGNSVYLNKSNEVYEFSFDEVKIEETQKYSRIGIYAEKTIADSWAKDSHVRSVNQVKVSSVKKSRIKPTPKDATNDVQPAEGSAAQDNTSDGRPFFGVPIPEDSTPCTKELQAELLARYSNYNLAAEAGDFSEFEKHILASQAEGSKKALAGLNKKELQERRKILQGLSVKNYRAMACMFSPNTTTAAIAGRGKYLFQGKIIDAHGTISFKRENQSWKVQTTVWNTSM